MENKIQEVQFLGYGIHTGGKEENGNLISLGVDADIPGLTRLQAEEKDYKARISLLKAALDKAASASNIDSSSLKIFTVPEFFFKGQKNGYLLESFFGVDNAGGVLGELQQFMSDEKWANWVLVLGSNIVYAMPDKTKSIGVESINIPFFIPKNASEKTLEKKVDINNFTVVDAINYSLLCEHLEQEFKGKEGDFEKASIDINKINATVKEVAKSIVKGEMDSIKQMYQTSKEKFIYTSAIKAQKSVNVELKKITTAKGNDLMELLEALPEEFAFQWEKQQDPNKERDVYCTTIAIEGGSEAKEKTIIIIKPFYNKLMNVEPKAEKEVQDVEKRSEEFVTSTIGAGDKEIKYIDPWGLILNNGEIDNEKLGRIKMDKAYGSPLLSGWKSGQGLNPTKFKVDNIGIFKIGNLSFAIESGLDNANQLNKKILVGAKKLCKNKAILAKLFPEGDSGSTTLDLLEEIFDEFGVDFQIISSCGSQIYNHAVIAKANGWVFNCDGLNHMRMMEENKIVFSKNGQLEDEPGYKSVSSNPKTSLGNAHTGLMFSKTDFKGVSTESEDKLIPFEKVQKTKAQIQVVNVDTPRIGQINTTDLFWIGNTEGAEVPSLKGDTIKVSSDSPIGGAVVIYSEISGKSWGE